MSEIQRPFLINIHIPKCGGSTLHDILERNAGPKYHGSYCMIWRPFFTPDEISYFLNTDPRFSIFSTHEISLNLPWYQTAVQLYVTATIRDPVDRTISHYFFERQRGTFKFKDTLKYTLNEYVEKQLEKQDNWLFNYQFKHLTRHLNIDNTESLYSYLEDKPVWFIVLEDFDLSMLLLEKEIPNLLPECHFTPINASRHTETLNAELLVELRKRNEKDMDIHKHAQRLLKHRLERHFPNEDSLSKALDEFRSRCRKFTTTNRRKKQIKILASRIGRKLIG